METRGVLGAPLLLSTIGWIWVFITAEPATPARGRAEAAGRAVLGAPHCPAAPPLSIPPLPGQDSQSFFPHSAKAEGRPDPASGCEWNALDVARD